MSTPSLLHSRPATKAAAVTPNDSADLSRWARGIYVGVTGNVKLTTVDGDTVTLVGLAAGMIHPIATARVWSNGTTATSIVAVY